MKTQKQKIRNQRNLKKQSKLCEVDFNIFPKSVQEYLIKYKNEEVPSFNVHFQDKYGTFENLCKICLEKGVSIQELEPLRSRIET